MPNSNMFDFPTNLLFFNIFYNITFVRLNLNYFYFEKCPTFLAEFHGTKYPGEEVSKLSYHTLCWAVFNLAVDI